MERHFLIAVVAAALISVALLVGFATWSEDDSVPEDPFGTVAAEPGRKESPPEDLLVGHRGGPDSPAGGEGAATPEPGVEAPAVEDPVLEPLPVLALPEGNSLLRIQVRNARKEPLGGVEVTLRSGRASGALLTRSDGEVGFEGLAAGTYSALFVSEGRPELTLSLPLTLGENEELGPIEVELEDFDLTIAGRVIDESGEGVEGIEVVARPRYNRSLEETSLVPAGLGQESSLSGADGRFLIERLQEGEYELRTIVTEPWSPARQAVVRAGSEGADLQLVRPQELEVFGRVFDAQSGVGLAEVRVVPSGQTARTETSGEEGGFAVLVSLRSDRSLYGLRFLKKGYQEKRLNLRAPELEEAARDGIEVELLPLKGVTFLTGRVVDSEGQPLEQETVQLRSQLLGLSFDAVSGEDGRFRLDDLPSAQDFRLTVRPKGEYRDYARTGLHLDADGEDIEIVLEPLGTGRLSGIVVDLEGQPVADFRMWAHSSQALGKSTSLRTDSTGRFRLDGVPAGKLRFETSSPRLSVRGIELTAGSEEEVELIVDWGEHELRGVVTDGEGLPVGGARLSLSWFFKEGDLRSGSNRDALTGADGSFRFRRLGPGDHRITVNATGFKALQKSVDIGKEDELALELTPASR